jgi:hypothetical protein
MRPRRPPQPDLSYLQAHGGSPRRGDPAKARRANARRGERAGRAPRTRRLAAHRVGPLPALAPAVEQTGINEPTWRSGRRFSGSPVTDRCRAKGTVAPRGEAGPVIEADEAVGHHSGPRGRPAAPRGETPSLVLLPGGLDRGSRLDAAAARAILAGARGVGPSVLLGAVGVDLLGPLGVPLGFALLVGGHGPTPVGRLRALLGRL